MNSEKTNFEVIKDYIMTNNILPFTPPVPQGEVEKGIQNVKKLFSINKEVASIALTGGRLVIDELSEEEYEMLEIFLKSHINIEHKRGEGILGEQQKNRDNKWWQKYKGTNELYYWNLQKKNLENKLPFSTRKTLDDDTDVIMGYLGNPLEENDFERYGMVVGHVQSGKTANYSALISKAADVGYKIIVVVAGALNNLRNQTQIRLGENFIGYLENEYVGVGKLAEYKNDKTPLSLTSTTADFNQGSKEVSSAISLDATDAPFILVVKKHSSTLTNLNEWLKTKKINTKKHSILLIDDESDYASINTNKEKDDPTTINQKIRELLGLFDKKAYIAYTATPYANIFIQYDEQDEKWGKDLFPEDFIYALDAPSNYLGAAKIFLDPQKRFLEKIDDYENILPLNHKKDDVLEELPESLLEAIRLFCINVAIRHLRNQENEHNSMMVHITRFSNMHHNVFLLVSEYLENLHKIIKNYGGRSSSAKLTELRETYFKYYGKSVELVFSWEAVLEKIVEIIQTIETREVHANSKIPLEYEKDFANNYIVIGGTSLARGYTLEGLSVSYFLRSTIFYDTLMQMGRWFGYRNNYEDLCKIFMTEEKMNDFSKIIEATLDLVNNLEVMRKNKQTPREFGLAVKYHPESRLQVTAANKSRNTENIIAKISLDGHLKETSWLNADKVENEKNIKLIKTTIAELPEKNRLINFKNKIDIKNTIWSKIDKNIIKEFLDEFSYYSKDVTDIFGEKSRLPIEFIKQYVKDIDTDWDIVVHTGQASEDIIINGENFGKYQFRTISLKGDKWEFGNRNITSGSAEEATLTDLEIQILNEKYNEKKIEKNKLKSGEIEEVEKTLLEFSKRKEARRLLKRPLLMLHLIKADINVNDVIEESNVEIAAFSISFPSGIDSGMKNISIKVNSVYINELKKLIDLDGEEDD